MQEGFIEKSFVLEDGDLEKINQFTRTEFKSDELYAFSVILCDNNIDRDYEKFSVESLYQLCDKFLGKTGICDHSMKSADQKARIFHTWVEKVNGRKTQDGEDLYQLKAKAYMVKTDENMPLIKEIEAGIKKEVSVSCSMKKSICSICSNDKRSTYCEHINGKSYDGKLAYSVLSDVSDAYEFSFVAVPAQREAGVTKSFNGLKDDDNMMKNVIDTLKSCSDGITLSKAQAAESGEEQAKESADYRVAEESNASASDCFSSRAEKNSIKEKIKSDKNLSRPVRALIDAVSSALGVCGNTALVLGMIWLFYGGKTVGDSAITPEFMAGLVSLNFVIEVVVMTVLTPPIVYAIRKQQEKNG